VAAGSASFCARFAHNPDGSQQGKATRETKWPPIYAPAASLKGELRFMISEMRQACGKVRAETAVWRCRWTARRGHRWGCQRIRNRQTRRLTLFL